MPANPEKTEVVTRCALSKKQGRIEDPTSSGNCKKLKTGLSVVHTPPTAKVPEPGTEFQLAGRVRDPTDVEVKPRHSFPEEKQAPENTLYADDLPEVVEPFVGINFLKALHSQPNDINIVFVDEGHKYYCKWVPGQQLKRQDYSSCSVSVSGFVHQWFPEFNGREVVAKMQKSPRWQFNTKYHGMTAEQILASWKANGEKCSSQGSKFHYLLETFYNGNVQPLRSGQYADFKVVRMFLKWHDSVIVPAKLEPYRTEMQLMSEPDLRLTGTIDILFVPSDHPPPEETDGVLRLFMKDWKFSKGIKLENRYEKGLPNGPVEDLPNCNGYHYYLQLNSYKFLIENTRVYSHWRFNGKIYNRVQIQSMELVVFHDNQIAAETYPVPDMEQYVEKIVQRRRQYLVENPPADKDCPMPENVFNSVV
mmetsp:Transcript_3622/g.5381  ORF Transcript_3622/g.5381 Transcript_3622/m.5381 type:complete len:420 (-) Transcript_3622:58-1317(-)